MPVKAYYEAALTGFMDDDPERILGTLASKHHHALEEQQRWAWTQQIAYLKDSLCGLPPGHIFLEFTIPRMGKRADVLLVIGGFVFVVEFKVGASEHSSTAYDQVLDYALDLKNFHEGSHAVPIIPVLVSTHAKAFITQQPAFRPDKVADAVGVNARGLGAMLQHVLATEVSPAIDIEIWMSKGYRPTPTIIEAAQVLYETHSVRDIARSEAEENLHNTAAGLNRIIDQARRSQRKAVAFVTGVPGSGKTLAGLNFATRRSGEHHDEHAVFLSGNRPLVTVLREALVRDKALRDSVSKKSAEREVRSFIQNIHHFRDEYVGNSDVPLEKVVVFDEAQRAWTRQRAASFMRRNRGQEDFNMSEPEFLISVMDRHADWCTVICLVGEGQEINTGEAGISEWMRALQSRFLDWDVYASPHIPASQEDSNADIREILTSDRIHQEEHLHLAVSIRSFRAEALSEFIGHLVAGDCTAAKCSYHRIRETYPIVLTRDLNAARFWLRSRARGTERNGLVASSGAMRLRPEGIHMKAAVDPASWFLNERNDVRSSYYLEEVASEFDVQGLELDWVGVCWDGDFHHKDGEWQFQSFEGTRWRAIKNSARRTFLRNAYRVLLSRARQGMVLFVPRGTPDDPTRPPSFYDGTVELLQRCGIASID